jgi:formamidopyrimidine-DNA glycosylase
MPELPEVETVRRTLEPAIGATIVEVWDSGKGLHMAKKPPRKKLRALAGATITRIHRHGKYLLIETDKQTLLVHLGMTGRTLIVAKTTPRPKHTHMVIDLGDRELRFVDPRRFGQIDVVEPGKESEHDGLALLGPDGLFEPATGEYLFQKSRKKNVSLKAFVLDQSIIAGVGNIYASEALWRAKLRPTTRAKRLTLAKATELAVAIHEPARLRQRVRRRGQQRGLSVGLRAGRRTLRARPNEDSPLGAPRSSHLLLSNVSDRLTV